MTDPGTSMSLTAVLVMATVVLVLLGAWLIVLFLAARQPANGHVHPGGQGTAGAARKQADRRGADAASPRDGDTLPGQARPSGTAGSALSPGAGLSGGAHRAAFHGRQRPRSLPRGDIAAAHRILEHGRNA